MGGCASKPKELNTTPATLPGENPLSRDCTVKNVEVDTPAQEEKKVDEAQKDEPLVDLSEPAAPKESSNAEGDVSTETKNAINDLVSGIVDQPKVEDVTVKPTEEKVEAGNETEQQIKDEPAVADLAEKKNETPKSNATGDEQSLTPATAEKKTETPIVNV